MSPLVHKGINKEEKNHDDADLGAVNLGVESWMVSVLGIVAMSAYNFWYLIVENLWISESPIGHEEHEEWSALEEVDGSFV